MNRSTPRLLDVAAATDIVAPPRGAVLCTMLMLGIALLQQFVASVQLRGWLYNPLTWLQHFGGTGESRVAMLQGIALLCVCAVAQLGCAHVGRHLQRCVRGHFGMLAVLQCLSANRWQPTDASSMPSRWEAQRRYLTPGMTEGLCFIVSTLAALVVPLATVHRACWGAAPAPMQAGAFTLVAITLILKLTNFSVHQWHHRCCPVPRVHCLLLSSSICDVAHTRASAGVQMQQIPDTLRLLLVS